MPRLSAVLIVKNEADNIVACLESVSFADEIVVVDAGSSDATRDLAARYTDKVYVYPDWAGYGVQRQRAQAHARGDWVFMIDADERVTPALRDEIERVVADDDRGCAYAVPRLTWCFGGYIRHAGWYPDYVMRLYPAARARYDDALVHERLVVETGLREARLRGDLLHYSYRSLRHYLEKSAAYAEHWAAARIQHGKRTSLTAGLLHGVGCFLRMYVLKAGFLDGRRGFLLATLSAHSTFVKYADLWLRRQPQRPSKSAG